MSSRVSTEMGDWPQVCCLGI